MSVGYSLSLSDLLLVKGFKEVFGKENKSGINSFLFENGMDVEDQIDELVCEHRNLQGKVVKCLRYEGHERFDQEWLKSGNATWENIVEHCDYDLRVSLKQMSQQSNNTQNIIKEMTRHK